MAKILLIEDDPNINLQLSILLSDMNHTVICASNGNLGIKELASTQFDLVISDIFMPEVDGLEVASHLSAQEKKPKLIMMSGGGASIPADPSLRISEMLGADEVLQKPFSNDDFTQLVRRVLEN